MGRLARWAVLCLLTILLFNFLHETGHGVGAYLSGIHVSTGFNRVGNAGMRPSYPQFRVGMPNSILAGVSGPLVNLVLALLFTWLIYRQRRPSLLLGSLAVANAFNRLFALSVVAMAMAVGRFEYANADEVGLGRSLHRTLVGSSYIVGVLEAPALIEVWWVAGVSFGISLVCYWLANRRLLQTDAVANLTPVQRIVFVAMPFLLAPFWIAALGLLDELVRINW